MAKKTKRIDRGNPTTDGEEMLLDDDAASVAVAVKPERKAKTTATAPSKELTAKQRKTGHAVSKRAEAKAKKAGKANWDRAAKEGKAAAVKKAKGEAKVKAKESSSPIKAKAEKPTAASKKAKASSGKRLRTTVVHRAPKVGSKFTAKYKGKTYTMTVKTVKGETVYVVKGKAYKSPTAAASAVLTAGRSNGWTFWGIA